MKISLRWALEHIAPSSIDSHFDVKDLASKVNQSVVEIEHFSQLKIDPKKIFAAKVTSATQEKTTMFCQELGQAITLDAYPCQITEIAGKILLLKKNDEGFQFLKLSDIGGDKDSLVPPVSIADSNLSGDWKNEIWWEDIIFEVDNKSLTNRPDMWCHRGFAREFSMILEAELIKSEELLRVVPTICKSDLGQLKDNQSGFSITVNTNSNCSYYSGISLKDFVFAPSTVKQVFNLTRVGFKPINMVVDLTNYVCADWGQPMHAFDANIIQEKSIVVREALDNELMTGLDGKELTLQAADTVISDPEKAIALAGIIGSLESKITNETKNIILESATFAAAPIRRSAFRHKIRTESSMRFEKTLDRTRAKEAIYRFMHLAKKAGLHFQIDSNLLCIGQVEEPLVISVRHEFLERKIGTTLSKNDVIKTLEALEFDVKINDDIDYATIYEVNVPTWRLSKDIKIEEDIVEEVARCYGFNKIPAILPSFSRQIDFSKNIADEVKNFLVYSMDMTEQYNYCFNDVDFLKKINQPSETKLFVLNPVNQNTKYMVQSLIPGLLKNIATNGKHDNDLRFFEVANVWNIKDDGKIEEKQKWAGVLCKIDGSLNPFSVKSRLFKIFQFIGLETSNLEIKRAESTTNSWEDELSINELYYNQKLLGRFGTISKKTMQLMDLELANGFFFEFSTKKLDESNKTITRYSTIIKQQEQHFDVSTLAKSSVAASKLAQVIKTSSELIVDVKLIDSFEKKDWINKKSLTYRIILQGSDKTISRDEIEAIAENCKEKLKAEGVEIR